MGEQANIDRVEWWQPTYNAADAGSPSEAGGHYIMAENMDGLTVVSDGTATIKS